MRVRAHGARNTGKLWRLPSSPCSGPFLCRSGLGPSPAPPHPWQAGSPGTWFSFGPRLSTAPSRPPRHFPKAEGRGLSCPHRVWDGPARGQEPGHPARRQPPLVPYSCLVGQTNPSEWPKPTVSLSREHLRTFSPFWGVDNASNRPWPPHGKPSRGVLGSPLPRALGGPWYSDRARMWRLSSHTICSKACSRTFQKEGTSASNHQSPVALPSRGRLHCLCAQEQSLRPNRQLFKHPTPVTGRGSRTLLWKGSVSLEATPGRPPRLGHSISSLMDTVPPLGLGEAWGRAWGHLP